MILHPQYKYREAAIDMIIKSFPLNKQEIKALQNGYAFGNMQFELDAAISHLYIEATQGMTPQEEVPFEVICSCSNWFDAHPEKTAGKPEISSSLMFPIKIKGTKEDVIKMFANI